jgi:phosphoglycolate phosphatase
MNICLLDIDGTLILTGGAGQTAFAQTLVADFGIPELRAAVTFAGRSDRAIAMDLFRHHGVELSADNWNRFCTGYLSRLDAALAAHQGHVLPGAAELVAKLARRDDVALGLLTGNVREGARRKLTYYGLWDSFPFGGFGDDHLERCDIAAAALAAAKLHLGGRTTPPTSNGDGRQPNIIVIGDTPNDIACGRSIGALCVAVPTGHATAAELEHSMPDLIVNTLEDSGPILKLLNDS